MSVDGGDLVLWLETFNRWAPIMGLSDICISDLRASLVLRGKLTLQHEEVFTALSSMGIDKLPTGDVEGFDWLSEFEFEVEVH